MAHYWFLYNIHSQTFVVTSSNDTIGNSNLVAYTIVCHAGREEINLEQFREFREFKEFREFRDNF